ncbi:hypothetical protein [Eubacterium sp.]|uniref:hypothetical protein n=1 Tax=Eubacterium sp. TaxID=142586 RepID=UPI003A8D27A6
MIKCSICGEQVELRKENRYEVVIEEGALRKSFGFKDRLYEAFDCPHCGCQMLMNERFPVRNEIKIAEEHVEEYDGCLLKTMRMPEDTKTSEQKKVAVRSRFADCKCDAIETEWKDDDEIAGSRADISGADAEESVEEDDNHIDNKDLSCDHDYNAMTKEELVKLCKERGIKISSAKYVEKQCLIDKLVKNDKFMEGWE